VSGRAPLVVGVSKSGSDGGSSAMRVESNGKGHAQAPSHPSLEGGSNNTRNEDRESIRVLFRSIGRSWR
jgi:hypothetical protein